MAEPPPGYPELLQRLFQARRSGVRLELDRVVACLQRLGDPQARPRYRIHIGGTNGKGSTSTFVDSMLRAAGVRVGLFTSPHVNRFEERFRVNGQEASATDILAAATRVEAAIDTGDPLTFFELAAVIALQLFADADVDVAVLEVGIGGRYDATNAVSCEVAAVTGVSLEHQQYLGSELHHIAARKAGIFSPGQHAVIGAAGERAAIPVLRAGAERARVASLTVIDQEHVSAAADYDLGLAGSFQPVNAACALAVLDALADAGGPEVDSAARRHGLAAATLAGRFETLGHAPLVIVDGAHNPHGARALAGALADIARDRTILVTGVSGGKDTSGIVAPLAEIADIAIATQARESRALSAAAVAEALIEASPTLTVEALADVASAFERARTLAAVGDLVVVTGSLFVVGEVREIIAGAGRDPLPLTDPM